MKSEKDFNRHSMKKKNRYIQIRIRTYTCVYTYTHTYINEQKVNETMFNVINL